jgi:hypothetical protein
MLCSTGKRQHKTTEAAKAHADSLYQKFGYRPNIYSCQECGDLHVGGGYETQPTSQANVPSSADRLARFVPISVAQRTYKERIKVAAGKILTLEDLILEQLVKTFKTDKQIALELHCDSQVVSKVRNTVDEVNGYQRARRLLVNLLREDPKRSREALARMIAPISDALVRTVVKEMGLSGTGDTGSGMRRKFLPKERRQQIGKVISNWNASLKPEQKAEKAVRASKQMKETWQDPELREEMLESLSGGAQARWAKPGSHDRASKKMKDLWQDPEYLEKMKARKISGRTAASISSKEREQMSKRQKARWADPELRKKEQARSAALWQDPEYRKKVLAAQERHRSAKATRNQAL